MTTMDVDRMRQAAIDSQHRRAYEPWQPVTFSGGPLDGLRVRVLSSEAASPTIGFCTLTDQGPVQALYRPGRGLGAWVFERLARPGLD